MSISSCPKIIICTITTILIVLGSISFLFSWEPTSSYEIDNPAIGPKEETINSKKNTAAKPRATVFPKQEKLSELQTQARLYRSQGLKMQKIGNLEAAMAFYQKAIELDPSYAVVNNDLGVVYETLGDKDRAENSYLEALSIDPGYLSACTNLALFYESKRDMDKAAVYWKKRSELGSSDDPWTAKARRRFEDIIAVNEGPSFVYTAREHEALDLTKQIIRQKDLQRQDNRELAKAHFRKAKISYKKQDEVTALKEAVEAQLLDPGNEDVEKFIEKVQHRLLSR